MSVLADLRTLYHLCLAPVRGDTHAERLENFYSKQAGNYDHFRSRLLQGRRELFDRLPMTPGSTWVDLGGGTGSNLAWRSDRVYQLKRVDVIDLSPSLLAHADSRIREHGWDHVHTQCADATTFRPPEPVDCVTCSYALSMMPEWFAAIDNAWQMLRPGGTIGVVDFYVSHKFPPEGLTRHGRFERAFWPLWFSADNVWLGPDRLQYLLHRFDRVELTESRARVPFLWGMKVPYFMFVGRKGRD